MSSSLSDYVNQILNNYNIVTDEIIDDTTIEYLIEIVRDMKYDGDGKQEIIEHVIQFIPCLTENDHECLDTIIVFLKENVKSDHKLEHVFQEKTKSLINQLSLNDNDDNDDDNNNTTNSNDDNNKCNDDDNDSDNDNEEENKRYNDDMDFLIGMVLLLILLILLMQYTYIIDNIGS